MRWFASLCAAALLSACLTPAAKAPSSCRPCVSGDDCTGEACVQLAEDAVCARTCSSDADCAGTDRCAEVTLSDGQLVTACVARDDQCGALPVATEEPDAGVDPACAAYQGPDVANTCCRCQAGRTCTANGCYGGWSCDSTQCRCVPTPANCGIPSVTNDALRAGGPVAANVTARGGTMNRLHFAVVGDTRPAVINDTLHYPTPIITGIFKAVEAANPRPAFAVTTGDYIFASPNGDQGAAQFDLYLGARSNFSGPLFPAFGNHECTGWTTSNCGPGIGSGETKTYKAFMTKMLGPLGESRAYYSRRVDATDGSWSAKFVVVAPNSWSDAQGVWLEQALSEPTTYTFLVRHEPATTAPGASEAPGVRPSEAIAQRHPLTLALEGHAHTWMRLRGTKELVVGNGGAPITGSAQFGYTVISQRADGALVITNYALSDGKALYSFAVKADGSSTY